MLIWMQRRVRCGRKLLELLSDEPKGATELSDSVEATVSLVTDILEALVENGEAERFRYYGRWWYVSKGTDIKKFF